jgi:hypothetical protein
MMPTFTVYLVRGGYYRIAAQEQKFGDLSNDDRRNSDQWMITKLNSDFFLYL